MSLPECISEEVHARTWVKCMYLWQRCRYVTWYLRVTPETKLYSLVSQSSRRYPLRTEDAQRCTIINTKRLDECQYMRHKLDTRSDAYWSSPSQRYWSLETRVSGGVPTKMCIQIKIIANYAPAVPFPLNLSAQISNHFMKEANVRSLPALGTEAKFLARQLYVASHRLVFIIVFFLDSLDSPSPLCGGIQSRAVVLDYANVGIINLYSD